MPEIWELAATLSKVALYFGVLTAAGLVLVRLVFADLIRAIEPFVRVFALGCALLGAVAALAGFALRGAVLTGDAGGITDPSILGILWQTPVGTALALRLAGLGAMVLGLLCGGVGWGLALIGAGCALWSFAVIGHVAGDVAVWASAVLFLHLVAVAFWIGILAPLGKLAGQAQTVPMAAELGHRFGQIAMGAIPLLVLAGGVLSWVLVGSWAALIGTGYGIALLAKLGAVACLLGLGAVNKMRLVPRLRMGEASGLVMVLRLEWAVFGVVFLATAALTSVFALPIG